MATLDARETLRPKDPPSPTLLRPTKKGAKKEVSFKAEKAVKFEKAIKAENGVKPELSTPRNTKRSRTASTDLL
jgi:hypothetical protein